MPRPDRHRPLLLTAATTLLRRQGYAATSVGDVLRESGATNGSLYHHFPGGKEDLAQAAIAAAGTQIEAALRQAVTAAPDVTTAVQAWLGLLIRALEADPRDGCPVAPTAIEAAGLSDELREAAAGAFASWAQVLQDALGATRDRRTATAQARVLLSAIEGALLLDRTAHTTEHLRALRGAVPRLLSAG